MSSIVLKFKDAVLKTLPLDKNIITIGRKGNNDISIDNLAVSGMHARIIRENDKFLIEDLNSLNGTFINGQKITKKELANNDEVLIGKHTLHFLSDEDDSDAGKATKKYSMDETIIIDPKLQENIVSKMSETGGTVEKKDVLGGIFVIRGSSNKKEYILNDRITTIGKEESAQIKLKGLFAPKVSALINRKKEGYFITPSGKGKTPTVNSREIFGRYELKDGDIIEIGNLTMQFFVKE